MQPQIHLLAATWFKSYPQADSFWSPGLLSVMPYPHTHRPHTKHPDRKCPVETALAHRHKWLSCSLKDLTLRKRLPSGLLGVCDKI